MQYPRRPEEVIRTRTGFTGGTELGFSTRAVQALNQKAVSPALETRLFRKCELQVTLEKRLKTRQQRTGKLTLLVLLSSGCLMLPVSTLPSRQGPEDRCVLSGMVSH